MMRRMLGRVSAASVATSTASAVLPTRRSAPRPGAPSEPPVVFVLGLPHPATQKPNAAATYVARFALSAPRSAHLVSVPASIIAPPPGRRRSPQLALGSVHRSRSSVRAIETRPSTPPNTAKLTPLE